MSLETGEVLKDRYRIESVLGEGGMGTVYLAQDLLFERSRALKELYPDPLADEAKLHASRLQFEREAQALMKLRHKNLPHVSDYFSIDENDYLVMDYIEGESLAEVLARNKRPTEQLIYDWLVQVLDALEYCHKHNVLHRDIKPANLILTPQGQLMLVDFSLVKLYDPHNPRTATIVRGLGTPQYTPLEQYDASMGHTDARSDIYALGATLYHLLTGHPPQPVSQRILNPDTQPAMQELNPKLSLWMVKFVQKAMTIRPQDRYQSVSEMHQELETQLFKLKTKSEPRAAAVSPAPRVQKSQFERRQYRYKQLTSPKWGYTRKALRQSAPKMLPVVVPMLVPITVVLSLTVIVALLFAMGSSFVTVVVATPLILSAAIYYKLVSGRREKPPRF
jgi:serine/threonine protein kinase